MTRLFDPPSAPQFHLSEDALTLVERRFSTDETLSPDGIHARDEVASRTVERLVTDLNEQQHLLDQAGLDYEWPPGDPRNSHADSVELAHLPEQNIESNRELNSGADKSPRSQRVLAKDLAETILLMRTAALNVPGLSCKK